MALNQIAAIELVPHHAVIKACGLGQKLTGEVALREHARPVKKAVHRHLVAVDPAVVRDDEVAGSLLRALDKQARCVRIEPVVAVGKLQILAVGGADGEVARGRNAAVRFFQHRDAPVRARVHVADGEAHIITAIVDEEDLEVFIPLAQDAADAVGEMGGGVVYRNDDADKGFVHIRGFFLSVKACGMGWLNDTHACCIVLDLSYPKKRIFASGRGAAK